MNMYNIFLQAYSNLGEKTPLADKEKVGSVIGRNSGKSVCTESSITKPLAGKLAGLYSLRITVTGARVAFYLKSKENIVLVDTSHRRSDIYK